MEDDWISRPLGDWMAALIDYRGKTPTKTFSGIPLITAKVVKRGRIEAPDEFIAVDDYEAWMRRGIPKAGDVVITTEAPLGEVGQLATERVALAQRLVALRGKDGLLDNAFLKFLMQSESVQNQLRARAAVQRFWESSRANYGRSYSGYLPSRNNAPSPTSSARSTTGWN